MGFFSWLFFPTTEDLLNDMPGYYWRHEGDWPAMGDRGHGLTSQEVYDCMKAMWEEGKAQEEEDKLRDAA